MIDLHVHTDKSDGSCTPEDLVHKACALDIEALAIADHDTLAGYDDARSQAAKEGVELICAVELSTHQGRQKGIHKRERSVHLLGYFMLSPPTQEFRTWLEDQQASRRQRNLDLIVKLQQLGLEITIDDVAVHGHNQIGRPHFAKALCDKGYVSNLQEAFDVYLADGAQASIDREEPSLEEGIQRIRNGGGFASLAHPVRLTQRNKELVDFVTKLTDSGLQGIEVYHSEHWPADSSSYLDLARRLDLIPTGGSDFHGDYKPTVRLGTGIDCNLLLHYGFLEQIREMSYARH